MNHNKRLFILLAFTGLVAMLTTDLLVITPSAKSPASSTPGKIATWVLDNTRAGREAEFLVLLAEQADVSETATLSGKLERTRYVHDRLRDTAQRSQAPLLEWLRVRGIAYQSFFVVNAVLVKGTRELAETLAARPDVARIEGNPAIRQHDEAVDEIVEVIEPMLCHDDCFSLCFPPGHNVVKPLGAGPVEVSRGLVEYINGRICGRHRSARETLLLAT